MENIIKNIKALHIVSLFMLYSSFSYAQAQKDFLLEQKKHAKVKTAFSEKESGIAENLGKNGYTTSNVHILLVACKASILFIVGYLQLPSFQRK